MSTSASACGKTILCGEYAVVFGYPGIAVPSPLRLHVEAEERDSFSIEWNGVSAAPEWKAYAEKVLELLSVTSKHVTIKTHLPIGKGMGSSTALVIALTRLLKGDDKALALAIEDEMNPGHSGLDFEVIWQETPLLFQKGTPSKQIPKVASLLQDAVYIDSGTPNEKTPELVAWIQEREEELRPYLEIIGSSADRILKGDDLKEVIKEHHRAQTVLGVVPEEAQKIIFDIEANGGAAKVIGAGARTGGGGMILSFA